jgi:2-desacetyl-2-hydroxyethyl bacteriochlorophyllide A dehydrogenase
MNRRSLWFVGAGRVDFRDEGVGPPSTGEALVQTLYSAISPGTEMLVYRQQVPADMPVDESIGALAGTFTYPLKYGYAAVGRVVALGPEVEAAWRDRMVFAFNPHETHFVAATRDLIPLPDDVDAETALFLANMETAVNFLLDGAPLVGERVVVLGQGVVGLLTTALLARLPLATLTTFDLYPLRRSASVSLGAHASLDPADALPTALDADLTYELSGSPATLDLAIAVTGFGGRIIVGSWYGEKRTQLDLGGRFHRSRLRLSSSQVSTLTPELLARWTKARRLGVAWDMLRRVEPARFITHRIPFHDAPQAYDRLDHHPADCIQVILTY